MNLRPAEHIQEQLFWYGYYERAIGTMINKLLKPESVFLDIGANIGYFSILAAKHHPSCQVVAFEPVTELFEEMKRNIELNKVTNITVANLAASENTGESIIYLSSPENLGMSSLRMPENYSGKMQIVKVIDIDSWFSHSELQKVDLVKIDVEGSEIAVLKGMKKILREFCPPVIIEVNPETLSLFALKTNDLADTVDSLGYNVLLIHENGSTTKTDISQIQNQVNVLLVPPGKQIPN